MLWLNNIRHCPKLSDTSGDTESSQTYALYLIGLGEYGLPARGGKVRVSDLALKASPLIIPGPFPGGPFPLTSV